MARVPPREAPLRDRPPADDFGFPEVSDERLRVDALEAMASSLMPANHISHTGNTAEITVVSIS
ncbi:hypothetical protein GSI01S_13_00360 [Gordonia sihwensis NBRC 108236]|uniref:Uncharacterized protein n=2 Tax=Gordonia TaxID=2053 RepID=L7LLC6_9ACTN|nr:hypothetical protein GSI01S_13_00360 [Gordonia sihwensis NBRC 108236]